MTTITNKENHNYSINQLLKFIWIISILRLLFLVVISISLIVTSIILKDISVEINHFMLHTFDCCHYMF